MWNLKPGLRDRVLPIQEEVEVDRAWPERRAVLARPSELAFDREEPGEEVAPDIVIPGQGPVETLVAELESPG